MEISNEELFQSALSDEPIEVREAETPHSEPESQSDTRARDEQGRFAKREEAQEPESKVEQQAKPEPKDEGQIPSWRLREIREERDQLRQQLAQFQRQTLQPKPEATPKPDLFEKPDEFVRSNVQEALSPIEQKFSSFIETVSRRDAIREHGDDRVTEAYRALDKAAASGDAQAMAVVNAVKQSMDPYGDIVRWYGEREPSLNPQAFFQRQLEVALKDEKFKGELLSKLQPAPQEKPKPVFNVPPSLNRAASAASVLDEGGDFSNESLFANAMR